jgi:hypothetical protein
MHQEDRKTERVRGLEVHAVLGDVEAIQKLVAKFHEIAQGTITWEVFVIDLGDKTSESEGISAVNRSAFNIRTKKLQKDGGESMLAAPKVITKSGQLAEIQLVNQISYVKDYQVEVINGSTIIDPTIAVLSEGLTLELSGIVSPSDGVVTVHGELHLSHVERPIQEVETKVAGTKVLVQLPRLASSSWHADNLRIGPGEEGFMVPGLKWEQKSKGGESEARNVELWCFFKVMPADQSKVPTGTVEIVNHDEATVVVQWGANSIVEAPWDRAPREIGFYKGSDRHGVGLLVGGWVLLGRTAEEGPRNYSMYQMVSGSADVGDTAK